MTDGPPAPAPDGAVPPAATATTGGNVSAAVALAAAAGSTAPNKPPPASEKPPAAPSAPLPKPSAPSAATKPAGGGSDDLHPPSFAVAASSAPSSLGIAAAPPSSSGLPLVDFRQKRGQVSVAPSPPKAPPHQPSAVPSSSAAGAAAAAAAAVGGGAAVMGEKGAKKKAVKPKKKKGGLGSLEGGGGSAPGMGETKRKPKKKKEKSSKDKPPGAPAKSGAKKKKSSSSSATVPQRPGSTATSSAAHPPGYSAQQAAVHDMMRRALEEDQYSALGSVVDTDSSDGEDGEDGEGEGQVRWNHRPKRGGAGVEEEAGSAWTGTVKLDRASLHAAMRRHLRLEGAKAVRNFDPTAFVDDAHDKGTKRARRLSPPRDDVPSMGEEVDVNGRRIGKRRKKKKGKSHQRGSGGDISEVSSGAETPMASGTEEAWDDTDPRGADVGGGGEEEMEYGGRGGEAPQEEGSIFGQTAGASNATWVECDRCKKWRRLRGVVDARKLPSRWYCSMNKTDPDRARCSAPEEEYDAATTPESAADHRARRHLRVWVRRLHCNEAYENRQRGNKKRASAAMASSGTNGGAGGAATEPYEWVRCCNPSCGKWRMLLRSMDAASVMDGCADGEWYCVMNTWDEKAASCGAAQENLPAVGCPPWVMVDDK